MVRNEIGTLHEAHVCPDMKNISYLSLKNCYYFSYGL